MSQHKYSATAGNGETVTVTMGYDRPLDYVFCNVLREEDDEDVPLYSNLDDDNAGIAQQEVEY